MLVSQRKFAKLIGRSHAYVNKLVKQGVIPTHNGKINPEEAKRILEEHKDPAREAQRKANAKRRKEKTIFDAAGGYESLADMTPEERKAYEEERRREAERAKRVIEEVERAGLEVSEELKELAAKSSLNEAKTISEILNAKLKEIQYKKEVGELVSKAEVEREAFEVARKVRDAILSVPDRVSAMIAAKSDPKEIRDILTQELHHALAALSKEAV